MSFANFKSAMGDGIDSECCKRKRSEEEGKDRLSNVKRIKYAWHVVLASKSSPSSDDNTESVCSIQDAETVYAYDTEDTSTNKSVISSDNADDSIHEEYDPISLSADENLLVADSSSDIEIQNNKFTCVGVTAAIAQQAAFDSGLADNSDNSRTSFHSEIYFARYRTCFQCNTSNNDAKFPYCHKCYTERKNHLPPRPNGKKRCKKLSRIAALQNRSVKESQDSTAFDSGAVSNQQTQRSLTIGFKKIDIENDLVIRAGSSQCPLTSCQESVDTVDTGISRSQPGTSVFPQSSSHAIETLGRTTDSNENESAEKIFVSAIRTTLDQADPEKLKCKICRDAPRNTALVHNRSTHIACCYPCAKKIWRTTKRCPICNRKIVNVLHAYFA